MITTISRKVTGVKGASESIYRSGDVTLTCANLGAATAFSPNIDGNIQHTLNVLSNSATSSNQTQIIKDNRDKDGHLFSRAEASTSTSGTNALKFGLMVTTDDTNFHYNQIELSCSSDGLTKGVTVTDPAAWRTALDLNNNYLPRTGGSITGAIIASSSSTSEVKMLRRGYPISNSIAQSGIYISSVIYDTTKPPGQVKQELILNSESNRLILGYDPTDGKYVSLSKEPWKTALGIGTITQVKENTGVSAANNTLVNITSITLPAGSYILKGGVNFGNNAEGYRQINISTSDTGTTLDGDSGYGSQIRMAPASGINTFLQLATFVSPSTLTTYYLNAKQTSGSTLTLKGMIEAIGF